MSAPTKIGIEYLDFDTSNGVAGKLAHMNSTYSTPCYFPEFKNMIKREIEELDLKRLIRGQIQRQQEYEEMARNMLFYDRSLFSIIVLLQQRFNEIDSKLTGVLNESALDQYFILSNKDDKPNFSRALKHLPERSTIHWIDPKSDNVVAEIKRVLSGIC